MDRYRYRLFSCFNRPAPEIARHETELDWSAPVRGPRLRAFQEWSSTNPRIHDRRLEADHLCSSLREVIGWPRVTTSRGALEGIVAKPNDPTRPIVTLKTSWHNVRTKAGVTGRWHDNRHTLITDLAESGAGDEIIRDIAGHVSPRMLKHYSHIRMTAKPASWKRAARSSSAA
jgi:hypothetical protein